MVRNDRTGEKYSQRNEKTPVEAPSTIVVPRVVICEPTTEIASPAHSFRKSG